MSDEHNAARYRHGGCRCWLCRRAHAAYMREARQRRKVRLADNPDVPHGRQSTYTNHDCRCDACTEAHRLAVWAKRHPEGSR